MSAPVVVPMRSSRIVLPAFAHMSESSISSICRSGPPAVVTMSRNAATCGCRTSFAISWPGGRVRLDDAVGARAPHLAAGVLGRGSRDDEQVRPRRPRGDDDVEVVDVRVARGDEPLGVVEADGLQVLVAGSRPLDVGHAVVGGEVLRVGRVVEHDVRHARVAELVADAAADPAVAADDVVVAEPTDHAVLPPLGQDAGQDAVRDQLDDRARQVAVDCHSGEDDQDGHDLAAASRRLRVDAGERDRHRRAVEGRERVLVHRRPEGERAETQRGEERCNSDLEVPERVRRRHA